ncbi:MAG TPA: fused MFS/spermidine synthase [Candidatus Margulisiibacteriota bacterium]|nr:fused MFS/spermidine synthase [Candidatus Margulisiibacteriota bacterium]
MASNVTAALWLCFGISGAAALALEMLWMRSAGLVLGQTPPTVATVLACYFGGLGLGAIAGRGVRRRPVHVYGWLELGAACGALWSLAVFRILSRDAAQAWLEAGGALVRVGAVGIAIVPATLCLGATLPALGQALAGESVGRRGAGLYALNALGGVVGIAAAGFGLPALIGVRASYVAAAATSALAGVVALIASGKITRDAANGGAGIDAGGSKPPAESLKSPLKGTPRTVFAVGFSRLWSTEPGNSFPGGRGGTLATSLSTPSTPPSNNSAARFDRPVIRHPSRPRLRFVAAGAGALALALEVLWTRLFAQVLHNSVYSFSAIALVFLLAIACGAAAAAQLLRRAPPRSLAATALIAAGLATTAGVWTFVRWTDGLAYMGMHSSLSEYLLRIVALAAATAGPAAFASGIALPALWAAWGGQNGAARPLGDLSAANTAGGIVGALAAGFLAVPLLGVPGTLLAATVAYLLLANVIAWGSRLRPLTYVTLLAVVVANPLRMSLVHLQPGTDTLRAMLEGANGIVTVVDSDGDLQLRLDNYYVLGGSAAAVNERRLGLVPLLLHPDPHRVAFIGLATGITASAAPALGVDQTTVVEVVPEVAALARTHFAPWNAGLLERPNVQLVLDDGRRFLAAGHEHFDVIVSDLFIPWHAGAGNLYSTQMYKTVAHRLAPGGLFCQWLPLYQLTRDEFDMIARTFMSVFPQVSLWRADFYPNRAVVGLVGRLGTQPADLEQIGERLAQLPEWSRDPLLSEARGLAMLSAGPLTPVAELFAAAPVNSDDRPLLEFTAPRLTRITAAGDKDWFTGEALADFYETLAARTAETPDPLLPATDSVAEARRAGVLLYRYALAATSNDEDGAARLEQEVRTLVPEVVRHAESAETVADLAEARRTLAHLRSQREQVERRVAEIEEHLRQLSQSETERQ